MGVLGGVGSPGAGIASKGTLFADLRFSAEGVEAGAFETEDADEEEGTALVEVDRNWESVLLAVLSRASFTVLALSRGLLTVLGEGEPAML